MDVPFYLPPSDRLLRALQVFRNIQQMIPPSPLPSHIQRRDSTVEIAPERTDKRTESAWPMLPLDAGRSVSGEQMGRIMLAILGSEDILGDSPNAGLTLTRLKQVMKDARFDDSTIGRSAGSVCVWLARAGLLAEGSTESPWTSPRPMRFRDADRILAEIRSTPPPDPAEVRAERERGLR